MTTTRDSRPDSRTPVELDRTATHPAGGEGTPTGLDASGHYVWTDQEVKEFFAIFEGRNTILHEATLFVEFETTREFVEQVLPPCLQVPDRPRAFAAIATARESFKGRMIQGAILRDEEEAGLVGVNALHNGVEGCYLLTAIVSGDMQVSTGREAWGNPKKRGEARLYSDGSTIFGYAEREGARVLEISASLGEAITPQAGTVEIGRYFELRGAPAPDGSGLLGAPALVTVEVHQRITSAVALKDVDLQLRGSLRDPVDTVPIGAITDARYVIGSGPTRPRSRCSRRPSPISPTYLAGSTTTGRCCVGSPRRRPDLSALPRRP